MPLPENPPLGRLPFPVPDQFPPDLAEFWELWRHEKFWACHEALEEVWKAEADAGRKQFLQGLIHGAVAVFQFRRGNYVGAVRQQTRAWWRMQASRPERDGVDVTAFLVRIEVEILPSWAHLTEKQLVDCDELQERLRRSYSS